VIYREPAQPGADAPVGVIISDLTANAQTLVRQEVALVQAQVRERVEKEARQKGIAVAMLAGAAVFALFGLGFLGLMLVMGLHEWFLMARWLAALIVTLLYFGIAATMAVIGRYLLTREVEETP
jgi:fatty acid desaturase